MIDDDIILLKESCNKNDVSYTLAKILFDEYFPLLDNAHRKLSYHFDKEFLERKNMQDLKLKNSKRLIIILNKLKQLRHNFTREEIAAISLHTEHFAAVEGMLNTGLGFLIWTIINNGYTFKIGKKVIKTYDEIVGTSFGQKIRFLKNNKLFKVITDGVSADSRNNIGHLIYTIEPNGNILFDGKPVDYEKTHRWVREVGFSLNIIVQRYYHQYVRARTLIR